MVLVAPMLRLWMRLLRPHLLHLVLPLAHLLLHLCALSLLRRGAGGLLLLQPFALQLLLLRALLLHALLLLPRALVALELLLLLQALLIALLLGTLLLLRLAQHLLRRPRLRPRFDAPGFRWARALLALRRVRRRRRARADHGFVHAVRTKRAADLRRRVLLRLAGRHAARLGGGAMLARNRLRIRQHAPLGHRRRRRRMRLRHARAREDRARVARRRRRRRHAGARQLGRAHRHHVAAQVLALREGARSEEHTSELQSPLNL